MNEWNYLNETNLMQLIEDAEQNPVCKAPDYLKHTKTVLYGAFCFRSYLEPEKCIWAF